jgi:hypothetical protein
MLNGDATSSCLFPTVMCMRMKTMGVCTDLLTSFHVVNDYTFVRNLIISDLEFYDSFVLA